MLKIIMEHGIVVADISDKYFSFEEGSKLAPFLFALDNSSFQCRIPIRTEDIYTGDKR